MPRTWCVWLYFLGTCTPWLCYTTVIFPQPYLSVQSSLRLWLESQCINCANHIHSVVHAQEMLCMALFVRDMCTVAVLGRGNFPTASFVHSILPTTRSCINCANHIYSFVHSLQLFCMALFFKYMCTAAVQGRGNFAVAIFVHIIHPAARTCIFLYHLYKSYLHSCTCPGHGLYALIC